MKDEIYLMLVISILIFFFSAVVVVHSCFDFVLIVVEVVEFEVGDDDEGVRLSICLY